MARSFFWSFIVIAVLGIATPSKAQWISYETKVVADNLNVPWEIRWGYDGWIWFTERSGRFTKINPETSEKKVLLRVPDADHSDAEKGTLGFDFHPDFPDSPFVFIAYNYKRGEKTAYNVVRWKCIADTLVDPKVLLDDLPTGQIHNGSRVRIGQDKKLYISTGEADHPELAQDTSNESGKILRLELDGSIPKDNPFPGNPIWSYGHRNPQGLTFSSNGKLYSTEHGPASDDELNLIEKGRNYGWPLVEGYCDREIELKPCDSLHVKQPLMIWTPTVAVTGIEYCDAPTFPEWRNSILLATLKDQSLWVLRLSDNGDRVIATYRYPLLYTEDSSEVRRLRDYCFSPDGRLFVSTSNIWSAEWNPDKIIEIKRVAALPFEVTKLSPLNGARSSSQNVVLVWEQDAGDSKYEAQVSTDPEFDQDILFDTELVDTSVSITLASSEAPYFWRVRELTSSGPWSGVDSFSVQIGSDVHKPKATPTLSVFPNPAYSMDLRISVSEQILQGSLVDDVGHLLRTLTAEELALKRLSLKELTSGSYFLRLVLSHSRTYLVPFHVLR